MSRTLLSAIALSLATTFAYAQTTPPAQPPAATTPAMPAPPAASTAPATPPAINTAPLEPGANSFTEAQARRRLEDAGLSAITDLAKDDQGVWRGRATRNGTAVAVGLDFRGNIAAQ
ncbi:PepSY domain-containing protein [Phreatobacter aquaticus]|uniref:PepSY domain-containing protein n=1 Tax=Phreatobacter aquaticus TaxID=2570229 RepID=A0A4D7QIA4_9HYPH|nr:PepSY domain-containing protein [Phreatobacter aquaticus]QCK85077.1 PepSY domain-containing protein [Phreatobacter aquaticus]